MNKILQSDMFMKTWMWNGQILCFVALNIAMNLSDHLCSAEASTNGEFHLHNAKRKQYSSILHSLSHKLWNCNILNIHSIEIQSKNPYHILQAAVLKSSNVLVVAQCLFQSHGNCSSHNETYNCLDNTIYSDECKDKRKHLSHTKRLTHGGCK